MKNFLSDIVFEYDLSDEMFDFQSECIGYTPTREDAEELYPQLVKLLEESEVFENNPELEEIFKENKDKIIDGLISFIEYATDGMEDDDEECDD